MACPKCEKDTQHEAYYLPKQFCIKIGNGKMKNQYDRFNLPKFPGFIINKLIQFNVKIKHFRTIKWIGKKYIILDKEKI